MLGKIQMTQEDSDRLKASNHSMETSLKVAAIVGGVKFYREHPDYKPPTREPAPKETK